MKRVIYAETTRLIRARYPYFFIILGCLILTFIQLGTIAASDMQHLSQFHGAKLALGPPPVAIALHTTAGQNQLFPGVVSVLVFPIIMGALIGGGDFKFGTMIQLFLAVANRRSIVLAKAVCSALAGLIFGIVVTAFSELSGILLLRIHHIPLLVVPVSSEYILLGGLASASVALFGCVVTLATRNQTFGLVFVIIWSLLIEGTIILIDPSIGQWLPTVLARDLSRVGSPNIAVGLGATIANHISPLGIIVGLMFYTMLFLSTAYLSLVRYEV